MDRKALLLKLEELLEEALYLMETTEAKPDDGDEVWAAITEAYSMVETKLDETLAAEMGK